MRSKIGWQLIERRVARVESYCEALLRPKELRVPFQPTLQCLSRRVACRQCCCFRSAGIDFAAKYRGNKVRSLWKATVERAHTDTGSICDLPHRRIDARLRKKNFGRLQHSVFAALRISANAPLWCSFRASRGLLTFRQSTIHHKRLVIRSIAPHMHIRSNAPASAE